MSAATALARVPLTRLDDADPELTAEILARIGALAGRATFIGGEEVEAFEAEFAAYCGVHHAVGVSSGTDALALALRALDIGPGDEVIVPANSFIATAEAVSLTGAKPRFADVDADDHLITAAQVAAVLGPRTRAVIPVHLYGRTVDMDPLLALARTAGLRVVEDACQAHGALGAGARGDCGAFSFYPSKNLGAWGDAGAVVTNDAALADRVRLLRSHGERPRYRHRLPGTTARLDAIQAAVLRAKLPGLDAANARRRRLARALTRGLAGSAVRPPATVARDHVHHLYVVTTDDRGGLRRRLDAHGVASAVHYPTPIHRTEAYAGTPFRLPVSERLASEICTLPLFPAMTDADVERVIAAIATVRA